MFSTLMLQASPDVTTAGDTEGQQMLDKPYFTPWANKAALKAQRHNATSALRRPREHNQLEELNFYVVLNRQHHMPFATCIQD